MIKKFRDIEKNLDVMRQTGIPVGDATGFKSLDEIFTIKQGSFTFVLAAPHHGKSELCFELAFNQAVEFGKKSLIYSPETGSVEDIYAEFIHKYTGKPFFKSLPGSVDDKEYYAALGFIDEMFSVVDSDDQAFSFQELTKMVTDEEIIISDPYNELKHDMSAYGSRQDLYIEDLMGEIRRYCKKNKKHCIQTLHPASQQLITVDGISYYPMPLARGAAGGQALLRKAMTWINMWRPPQGLNNPLGMPYLENEVLIMVEKAKPKGVAKRGQISLYFDWKRNRYYEKIDNENKYAFDHKAPKANSIAIQPNINFDASVRDDSPF